MPICKSWILQIYRLSKKTDEINPSFKVLLIIRLFLKEYEIALTGEDYKCLNVCSWQLYKKFPNHLLLLAKTYNWSIFPTSPSPCFCDIFNQCFTKQLTVCFCGIKLSEVRAVGSSNFTEMGQGHCLFLSSTRRSQHIILCSCRKQGLYSKCSPSVLLLSLLT